jgi:hypothetical protein
MIDYVGKTDEKAKSIFRELHDAHVLLFHEVLNQPIETRKATPEKVIAPEITENTAKLLEAAENLEKENEKLRSDKENLIISFDQERREYLEQISSLQEENSKYLNTIIKHSKDNAENNLSRIHE